MAILVLGDYDNLNDCIGHLDAVLSSDLPDERKQGTTCVKMTRLVEVIKGAAI